VANVRGTAISRALVAHWTQIKRIEMVSSAKLTPGLSAVQLERKALGFLITADWLQGEAAAQGVAVSPSEVDATYKELLGGPVGQSFASSLKRRGLSRADELLELRLDKLAAKLRSKIVARYNAVSTAQIADYYHAHTSQFEGHGGRPQTLAAATPAIRETLLQAGQQRQVNVFVAAYRQRWKLRTTCWPGYVIPECRNGPPLPVAPTN
jgi:hypothetical protein